MTRSTLRIWAGWLTPARPTPSPAGTGTIDHDRQPDGTTDQMTAPLSGVTTSLDREVLRERMRALRAPEVGERVQKNLSLLRNDSDRLAGLSRRDRTSQARILALALDCYEQAYGPLDRTNVPAEPSP